MIKGLAVHFRFGSRGYPEAAEDIDLLSDSIETILKTVPGERPHRPTFGSNLRRVLFSNMSRGAALRARTEAKLAIRTWEPRVVVDEIYLKPIDNRIEMIVVWRWKRDPGRQRKTNLVFGV